MTFDAAPGPPTPGSPHPRAGRRFAWLGPMAAGAALVLALGAALVLGDWMFGRGRLLGAALGSASLAEACREPLVRHLAERGFEPGDVEFGPTPRLGAPWSRERTFGDSFTFQDGAGETRVDGVMACVVSGAGVTVEFRVGSAPRRNA